MDVATGIIRPDANLIEAFLDRYERPQTRKAYGDDLSAFFGSDFVDTVTVRDLSLRTSIVTSRKWRKMATSQPL